MKALLSCMGYVCAFLIGIVLMDRAWMSPQPVIATCVVVCTWKYLFGEK